MPPARDYEPPVRDFDSYEDPRAVALAEANAADDQWANARPGERADPEGSIPRALRAKGYEQVAELIGAWTGERIDTGTVRSWWRFDMNRATSRYLPPPDAIIKRKGGLLLPGWADETITEWLGRTNPATRTSHNSATWRRWRSRNDETDPRIAWLVAGNEAHGIQPSNPQEHFSNPPQSYLALGYTYAARVMSDELKRQVLGNTVCKYWDADMTRPDPEDDDYSDPYSLRMPIPDAIISRGTDGNLLPGWTQKTISAWIPTRPGPGNRTSGETRRGYRGGRVRGVRILTASKA